MVSKFQKIPFPIDMLGRFKSITVKTNSGETVEINYKDLKLVFQNGQICFYYESSDGDLLMPIARENTILSLINK